MTTTPRPSASTALSASKKSGSATWPTSPDRGAGNPYDTREGEPCHIIGGGPIPVSLVRELGEDAFLKAVLHDGTDIHTIAHFGRRYPATLRTALMLGPPPAFEGPTCSAPNCDRRYHLERDHIDPCANGGQTTFKNLAAPCWPHHQQKTERDRAAGLLTGKARGPD